MGFHEHLSFDRIQDADALVPDGSLRGRAVVGLLTAHSCSSLPACALCSVLGIGRCLGIGRIVEGILPAGLGEGGAGGSTIFQATWQEKWGLLRVEAADYVLCNSEVKRLNSQTPTSIPGRLPEALSGCPETLARFIPPLV